MRYHLAIFIFATAIFSSVIISAPASAAPIDVTVTCSSGTVTATPSSVGVTPGDMVRLINNTGGNLIAAGTRITPNPLSISATLGTTGTFTVVQNGSVPLNVMDGICTSGAPILGGLQLATGGSSSSSAESSFSPAPIFQQFGKPASGTCDAAAPATLNWSEVASGGWSESWARWMNGGNGGAVCTRTLVYSTEQSRWIIG